MRIVMIAAVGMLAATAGMAYGETGSGLSANILGVCKTIQEMQQLAPTIDAQTYMHRFQKIDMFGGNETTRILVAPKNGRLELDSTNSSGLPVYNYTPNSTSSTAPRQDSFEIAVEGRGIVVRIRYHFQLLAPGENTYDRCNRRYNWKISLPTTSPTLDNANL